MMMTFWLVLCALVAGPIQQQPAAPATTVRGSVEDEQGRIVPDLVAVIFPAELPPASTTRDPRQFQRGAVSNGQFMLSGMPAGAYRLAVLTTAATTDWPNDDLLARLRTRGLPVQVSTTSPVVLNITVSVSGNEAQIVRAVGSVGETVRLVGGVPVPARAGGPPPPPAGSGAIAGRILDAAGQPLAGAEVRAMRQMPMNGEPQIVTYGRPAITTADGTYRISGLRPGSYLVVAPPSSFDLNGSSGLTVSHVPPAVARPDGSKLGYVTTFYPGVADYRRAESVTVDDRERAGTDFTLQRGTVVDVKGTITGGRIPTPIALIPRDSMDQLGGVTPRRRMVERDGSFLFEDIPLGEYLIVAIGMNLGARVPVTISGPTAEPVTVALVPTLTLHGRVEFKGAPPPAPTDPLQALRVQLVADGNRVGTNLPTGLISASGEFTIINIWPGKYRLVAVVPPPWTQLSGTIDGVDSLDGPIEVSSNTHQAAAVVSNSTTGVTGRIEPFAASDTNAAAILFSADDTHWTVNSRRVRVALAGPAGAFSSTGLPPGRYLAVAVRLPSATAFPAPALLRRLSTSAFAFELHEGERVTLPPLTLR